MHGSLLKSWISLESSGSSESLDYHAIVSSSLLTAFNLTALNSDSSLSWISSWAWFLHKLLCHFVERPQSRFVCILYFLMYLTISSSFRIRSFAFTIIVSNGCALQHKNLVNLPRLYGFRLALLMHNFLKAAKSAPSWPSSAIYLSISLLCYASCSSFSWSIGLTELELNLILCCTLREPTGDL